MTENNQNQENMVENATNETRDAFQSATNYVQNAVENAVDTTRDATQNLVNNVMNEENENNK